MKGAPLPKGCPSCAARVTRRDMVDRWPWRARVLFAVGTAVTLVWAPLALILIGPALVDQVRSKEGVALLVVLMLGPGIGIASFAGRRELVASCRSCGWRGAPSELAVAERE